MTGMANSIYTPGKLGKLPAKSDPRALHLNKLAPGLTTTPPAATNFWTHRAKFPLRSFGNMDYGDCTRAKQAVGHLHMERLEAGRTPNITDEEIIRVYIAMEDRLYGGGDNGAFETDALDCWRRPEYTFKDVANRTLTIDAYLKINHSDLTELRSAIWTSGAHGIAVCFNLPIAFSRILPPEDWAIPRGKTLIGDWLPGSWGGHSMWCHDYDEIGIWVDHTWKINPQRVTWAAVSAYMDEAHIVIDSIDYWRTRKLGAASVIDLVAVRHAVNKVSSYKIAA